MDIRVLDIRRQIERKAKGPKGMDRLAGELGVSRQYLYMLKNGKRNPSNKVLNALGYTITIERPKSIRKGAL